MKLNIIDSVVALGLDKRTVGVLKLVSEDGETVLMSQLVRTLHIMEYEDWDKFDKHIDDIISLNLPVLASNTEPKGSIKNESSNKKTIANPNIIEQQIRDYINTHDTYMNIDISKELGVSTATVSKYVNIIDPDKKKYKKKPAKVIDAPKKSRRVYHNSDEIVALLRDYVNNHESYTVNKMARDLRISTNSVSKYINDVDPGMKKHNGKSTSSILNFIKLSDEELQRKSWLDSAVSNYSKEFKMSKSAILNPVYKKLTEVYGIVFVQKSMDFLYEHKFTPVEDYPDVSKYELLILDPELFDISKSILMDKYEQV